MGFYLKDVAKAQAYLTLVRHVQDGLEIHERRDTPHVGARDVWPLERGVLEVVPEAPVEAERVPRGAPKLPAVHHADPAVDVAPLPIAPKRPVQDAFVALLDLGARRLKRRCLGRQLRRSLGQLRRPRRQLRRKSGAVPVRLEQGIFLPTSSFLYGTEGSRR